MKKLAINLINAGAALALVCITVDLIEVHGYFKGLVMSIASVAFGIMAISIVYPSWFRK